MERERTGMSPQTQTRSLLQRCKPHPISVLSYAQLSLCSYGHVALSRYSSYRLLLDKDAITVHMQVPTMHALAVRGSRGLNRRCAFRALFGGCFAEKAACLLTRRKHQTLGKEPEHSSGIFCLPGRWSDMRGIFWR